MNKRLLYLSLMTTIAITSCKLDSPPTCVTGTEKCELSSLDGTSGIYQICNADNVWGNQFVCALGCDKSHCIKNDDLMPTCSDADNGKLRCHHDDKTGMTIAIRCQYGYWTPQICDSSQCSEESGCLTDIASCKTNKKSCIDISGMNASLQLICGDTQWTMSYCARGTGCDGDACEDNSVNACGEKSVNCKEAIAHWGTGKCVQGQCILKDCIEGYHTYTDGEGKITCEQNSKDNCGEHGKTCQEDEACNVSAGVCGCGWGLIGCGGECVDIKTDINHCGKCNQQCTPSNNTSTAKCDNGTCIDDNCTSGQHPYENGCEKDDLDNCGRHDNPCTITMLQGSTKVSCDTGQCLATECDLNQYIMDDEHHICLPKEINETCTTDKCINSGNNGILYRCVSEHLENPGENCSSTDGSPVSCLADGSECGTCLNGSHWCSEDSKLLTCSNGESETQEDCSLLAGSDVNARSYCSIKDEQASCIKECIDDYHMDEHGNCTIQCQEGEVWNETDKKCAKPNCLTLTDPKAGDTCIFGRYMQAAGTNFKQDLEWQILELSYDEDDNLHNLLLISKYSLEAKPFSENSGIDNAELTNVWENSSLRSWLNGLGPEDNSSKLDYRTNNFMKTAFTDEERNSIYKVNNNPNPDGETADWVFLLSNDEITRYLNSNEKRKCYLTPYVKSNTELPGDISCSEDLFCSSYYWLRTPGSNQNSIIYVSTDGTLKLNGFNVVSTGCTVRPALRLLRKSL